MYCFFFNDTATTEIYTLSLHDALPISRTYPSGVEAVTPFSTTRVSTTGDLVVSGELVSAVVAVATDRKSTPLNSSPAQISYAVFCFKKKTKHSIKYHRSSKSTTHIAAT